MSVVNVDEAAKRLNASADKLDVTNKFLSDIIGGDENATVPNPAGGVNSPTLKGMTKKHVNDLIGAGTRVLKEDNAGYLQDQVTGLKTYPADTKKSASVTAPNNNCPSGTTALRDTTGGVVYRTSKVVSGAITALDFSAKTATVGGVSVELSVNDSEYKGLWPTSGGRAGKGNTYQTQVSGKPTGRYFTALKNTTVAPVGDDVNWREVVSTEHVTTAQSDVLDGPLFKGSNGDTVENGDSIPSGFSRIRINNGGFKYTVSIDPVLSGSVSELSGFKCKIGGRYVNLIPTLINERSSTLAITVNDTFNVTSEKLDFTGLKYQLFGQDKSVLNIVGKSGHYKGAVLEADKTQPTNNKAVLNVQACKGANIEGFVVEDGYNSCSLEYGEQSLPDRRCENVTLKGCLFKGSYIGLESFSALSCNIDYTASRKDRSRGVQHGLRITGYGKDHLGNKKDLRNMNNNYKCVVDNYGNGVSRQTGSYNNVVSATITNCNNGLHAPDNTTLSDAVSSSNEFIFTVSFCDNASNFTSPRGEGFSGTVLGCTTGWQSFKGAHGAKGNKYDLTLIGTGRSTFNDSGSRIFITMSDMIGGCVVAGNSNTVIVSCDTLGASASATALTVSGSGNTIIFAGTNINQSFNIITLSGNKNYLIATTPEGEVNTKVAFTGNDNIVCGHIEVGSVTGTGNDYSGVRGYNIKGRFDQPTVSGRASIPVNMKTGAYTVSVELLTPTGQRCSLVSRSASQIIVDVFESDGTPSADATYTFYVKGEAY